MRRHRSRRFWLVANAPPAAATTIPFGSVQVVVATSGLDSNNKTATAVCPVGISTDPNVSWTVTGFVYCAK